MQQGTQEWFDARKNLLTGSNVGAALGTNPWRKPEDLIRSMVRDYHGAESEFSGNIATEYGNLHEPLAVMEYMGKTGIHPIETGFHVHPDYDWLGASPDSLLEDDGVLEVKCPFGLRHKKGEDLVFKKAAEQPHYFAQMQMEMACTGRTWTHFYQWSKHGDSLELITFDHDWWNAHFPAMKAFYAWYISELNNPDHLEPKEKEINTLKSKQLLDEWDRLGAQIDDATARKKEIMATLIKASGEHNALIHGRKLTQVERKGSVSYAKALKELAPEVDLTPWTGETSSYWRLS